jgi:hypothetical protein
MHRSLGKQEGSKKKGEGNNVEILLWYSSLMVA